MTTHPLDLALQTAVPTVVVPKYGDFELLSRPGHRFLVAEDGMWLEVKRPWLYARRQIAKQTTVAMPYGATTPTLAVLCGKFPLNLVKEFTRRAVESSHTEIAAWLTWNELTGKWTLRDVETLSSSAGHIRMNRPVLQEGEHLVIDLHSHASTPPFFSKTDNKDDAGEVKFSLVVGNCHKQPEYKFRLCLLGLNELLEWDF